MSMLKIKFGSIYNLLKMARLKVLQKDFSTIEDCVKFCEKKNIDSYNNQDLSIYSFKKFIENQSNFKYENNYSHKFLIEIILIYFYKYKKLPRIIDIGGAFGENKLYLDHVFKNNEIIYDIVEVPNKVFLTKDLTHSKFYSDAEVALKKDYDLLFTSSTLQYFKKTYEILTKILDSKIKYIGFTRGNYHLNKELYLAQPSYMYMNGPGEGFVKTKIKNNKIVYYHNTAISYLKFKELILEKKYEILRETNGYEGNFGANTFNKNILLKKIQC